MYLIRRNKFNRVLVGSIIVMGVLGPLYSFNSGGESVSNAQGTAGACGSPGELGTCSQSGCHGAGNGGLADNAGPGSLTYSSVPAITGNNYTPGQLYHMTVIVSETGKAHYGFGCEILDNSGNTNTHVNNTAGTITVTDAAHTRTWQVFGSGRLAITQSSGGGYSSNSASFTFDWTAPNSGTVNLYVCGNATNNDAAADAGDNIYSQHIVLTPMATGLANTTSQPFSFNIFPVPAKDHVSISMNLSKESILSLSLYSLQGSVIKLFENRLIEAGSFEESYPLSNLTPGVYFLTLETNGTRCTKMLAVQ